jgi:SAM-dependent methyltransferase
MMKFHLPNQSFVAGFVLTVVFAFSYECANPKHGDHHHSAGANHHMHQKSVEELSANFDNPKRDEWQKPDVVLAVIASQIKNPRIWEIGAGSGYFSLRFPGKKWFTIASDPNPEFLAVINSKIKNLPSTEQKLIQTQLTTYEKPGINNSSINVVFSSNTYHHIENRTEYFQEVKKSLPKNGILVLVDFESGRKGDGPPESMRISSEQVVSELKSSGFTKFQIDTKSLPYQYIIIAR